MSFFLLVFYLKVCVYVFVCAHARMPCSSRGVFLRFGSAHCGLVEMQILIQQVWGGACESPSIYIKA